MLCLPCCKLCCKPWRICYQLPAGARVDWCLILSHLPEFLSFTLFALNVTKWLSWAFGIICAPISVSHTNSHTEALLHLAFNVPMVLGPTMGIHHLAETPTLDVCPETANPTSTLSFPPRSSAYLYCSHSLRPFSHRWTLGGISNACLYKNFPVKLTLPPLKAI